MESLFLGSETSILKFVNLFYNYVQKCPENSGQKKFQAGGKWRSCGRSSSREKILIEFHSNIWE